jgi:hypothetical protein
MGSLFLHSHTVDAELIPFAAPQQPHLQPLGASILLELVNHQSPNLMLAAETQKMLFQSSKTRCLAVMFPEHTPQVTLHRHIQRGPSVDPMLLARVVLLAKRLTILTPILMGNHRQPLNVHEKPQVHTDKH